MYSPFRIPHAPDRRPRPAPLPFAERRSLLRCGCRVAGARPHATHAARLRPGGGSGRSGAARGTEDAGEAAEQPGVGAVEAGDCRRAGDQAGGDGEASRSVSRSRTGHRAEPAAENSTRRSRGEVGGVTGHPGPRARDVSRGGMSQFVNLDKDPMDRRAESARGAVPGQMAGSSVPGHDGEGGGNGRRETGCNSRISTKTLWTVVRRARAAPFGGRWPGRGPAMKVRAEVAAVAKRGAIRQSRQRPYGPACDGVGGGSGSPGWQSGTCPRAASATWRAATGPHATAHGGSGWGRAVWLSAGSGVRRMAQFANLDKDPTGRRAVGLARGAAPTGSCQGVGAGREARLVSRGKDLC
jgi:hypothetical protein